MRGHSITHYGHRCKIPEKSNLLVATWSYRRLSTKEHNAWRDVISHSTFGWTIVFPCCRARVTPVSKSLMHILCHSAIVCVNTLIYAGLYSVETLEKRMRAPHSIFFFKKLIVINMHILHTVLYKSPKVLTRRICLIMKSSCTCWSFPLFSWL